MAKVLLAKEAPENQVEIKEFDSVSQAANHLECSESAIYFAAGLHGSKPYKCKGWHVDVELDKK